MKIKKMQGPTGEWENHYPGYGRLTVLCGQFTDPDENLGTGPAIDGEGEITCPHCLALIKEILAAVID